jgi:PPP family 3-phenylpropionic acid transporter
MIMLGGIGGVIRWTAMAFDPPTAALPLLQVLHALSFAATHLGTMHYLAQVAPAHGGATAQGDFVAVQGLVFAGAMTSQAFGALDLAYAAMVAAAAIGALAAGLALGRRGAGPAV